MKAQYSIYPQLMLALVTALLGIQFDMNAQGCTPPGSPAVTHGTRCGVGTMTLGATGSPGAVLNWYAAVTGGPAIGTGSVFTTPAIAASTNYYVSAATVSSHSVAIGAGSEAGGFLPYNFTGYNYGGSKSQYLYTAAELSSAGITAGNITNLKFELTAAGSNLSGFTVQMGTTTLTAFSYPVSIQGGLSTVYPATTYTPVVGVNTLNFPTPFNWDGVSNVIISMSWSNNNSTNTESTIKYDFISTNKCQSYSADNATAAFMAAYTGSGGPALDHRLGDTRPSFTLTGSSMCESPRIVAAASVTPPPALSASSPATVCANVISTASITSPASNYDGYTWAPVSNLYTDAAATTAYTGGTATVLYYKSATAASAVYTLSANNSTSSCANIATTTLTTFVPTFTASASPGMVCSGAAVTLSVTAGPGTYTWQWSPGAINSSTAMVNPVNTGTLATLVSYSISGTAAGCTTTQTLNVTVNTMPSITIMSNPPVLCATGSTATLTASGTSTAYAWSNGASAATVAVSPTVTTNYTVTGTNSCGTKTLSTTLVVATSPTLAAATSASMICVNSSAVLTASATAGATYSWSTGASAASIAVSPTTTITYTVTAANACGTATAAVLQIVSPCTGIEETLNGGEITFYPNPAGDYVSITLPAGIASANTRVEVSDALGKLAMAEIISAKETTLRLTELKEGVYFFKVIINNQPVKVGKVVKW